VFTVGRRKSGKAERYSGIAKTILQRVFFRMSQEIGRVYKFKIYHTSGNEYGILNHRTGNWSGALGELQQKVRCVSQYDTQGVEGMEPSRSRSLQNVHSFNYCKVPLVKMKSK
jgi:hypothetical protein